MLISVDNADLPYMTGRVKSLIPEMAGAEIYSLVEIGKFLDALPAVGLVLGILTAAAALWVCCCFMAKEPKKNLIGLIINIALSVLLLAGLFFTLQTIELPSSMLPREQITEFGYYINEFRNILLALECLTAVGDTTMIEVISDINARLWLVVAVGAGMALLAVALGVAEMLVSKKKHGKNFVEIKQRANETNIPSGAFFPICFPTRRLFS